LPLTLISVHAISRSISGERTWKTTANSHSDGSAIVPNQP